MNYHLTLKSGNAKTGPIPVSITSKESCPTSCAFFAAGCYAKSGHLNMHWTKVTTGKNPHVLDFDSFISAIAALPAGQVWRHNQAGDLPGINESIDTAALQSLTRANHGKRGFTYTHKPMTPENAMAVRCANRDGFTVNLSANNLAHADELKALNIAPVVVVVPSDHKPLTFTPAGHRVVVCPAQQKDHVTCATCKLCSLQRDVIVAFRAHGQQKKKVEAAIS